jgi:DUF4097 and DUF4098 domain-containing protein YvlB
VQPTDPSLERDCRVAEQTRLEREPGTIAVRAPRQRTLSLLGKPGSIDVTVELPAGSRLRADAAIATFRIDGRLGECRVKTSAGDIEVDQAGPAELTTSAGAIEARLITGDAEVSTGTGRLRLREVSGSAVVKTSNGDCQLGEVGGDLRVRTANGDITVGRAGAGLFATTANGDIRVIEVARGAAELKTGYGEIEIGIRPGTATRLDVSTRFGRVRNQLSASDAPPAGQDTLDLHARTSYGDIVIRHAPEQER